MVQLTTRYFSAFKNVPSHWRIGPPNSQLWNMVQQYKSKFYKKCISHLQKPALAESSLVSVDVHFFFRNGLVGYLSIC